MYENEELVIKLNNFFFKKLNLDYGDILRAEGYVKVKEKNKEKQKLWYEVYSFSNEEEYEEYKNYCLKEIGKRVPLDEVEAEFIYFDLIHGVPQNYLFNCKQEEEEVRVDSSEY